MSLSSVSYVWFPSQVVDVDIYLLFQCKNIICLVLSDILIGLDLRLSSPMPN